jgi:hypothetical protein
MHKNIRLISKSVFLTRQSLLIKKPLGQDLEEQGKFMFRSIKHINALLNIVTRKKTIV